MKTKEQPKLIAKRSYGNRLSYDIEINNKKLEVHETISENKQTHTFIVLSMKTPPTEEEENEAVVFIKKLTEENETEKSAWIGSIATLPKTTKPWGTEIKLSSFPYYVMKEIRILAGQRTSLQYHHVKHETLVFVDGKAIVYYKNKIGEIVQVEACPGTVVEFPPLAPHRVQAITDIRYFEASTPEIQDDTFRIDDDYGRRMVKQ